MGHGLLRRVIITGGGLPTEEKTVDLSMASGDQVVEPTSGKTLSKVTIMKPTTLLPANIKKDIAIGGVTGIYEGESGGGSQAGFRVRFIDYDGTLLKTQYVAIGEDATPPITPTHTDLTFQEWNNSYEDIAADTDIGATYITTDGKWHFDITLTAVTGLQPPIYLYNNDSNSIFIDLGDGSATVELTGTGNKSHMHTYAAAGNYTIKIWKTSGTFTIGQGTNTTAVIGGDSQNYRNTLTKVRGGNQITSIKDSAFSSSYSLTSITIPSAVTNIGMVTFYNCYSLASIIVPSGVTSLGLNLFGFCYNLTSIALPNGVTSIDNAVFSSCYSLTSITIPSGVTSIGTSAFSSCYSLTSYMIYAITPPTLAATNAFSNINAITKIYVPDASVDAYKAATNWATYANYIYPMSELEE